MEDGNVQSRFEAIERQAKRLARWLKLAVYAWLLTVFLLLLSVWTWGSKAGQESNLQKDVLRVRQLIVVDEKGIDRIVIGPAPDPQIMGKRVKRRSPGNGIQLNDEKGNERAGIALLDDGSAVVGIDDQSGRERAHLYFIPSRGAGLLLQDGKEAEKISLLIPADGEQSAGPKLEMTDKTGQEHRYYSGSEIIVVFRSASCSSDQADTSQTGKVRGPPAIENADA
jgi:hypothetical protein